MIKRRTGRTLGVAVALTLALLACGDNPLGPNPRDAEFAASLGIDLDNMTETATGMFVRDDVVGTGPAVGLGDVVTVNVIGWTADGKEFESRPFTFIISPSGAIAGIVEGVTGMQIGGERTIVVPAVLGYGSTRRQDVPADSVLIFSLTLTALN